MTPEEFLQTTREIERIKRDADKTVGARDQLLKELKKKLRCKTLKEAERIVKRMEREAEEAEQKAETALQEFEKEWMNEQKTR